MSKLGISIVNFNAGEYLTKCLGSLDKIKDEVSMEIWVVDNNSSDDSFEKAKSKFPKLNYIKNETNLGFGKAHNQVLKKLKTEYILILNPDTEISEGVLSYMTHFMDENKEVGVATCKILLSNGQLDWAAHRGFPTPYASLMYFLGDSSLYHLSNQSMDRVHEIDAVSGSFFLTRRTILEEVGYFDEDYFMYAEDIDLCYRIKQAGYKIMFVPEVSIVHHKGISSGLKKHSQETTTANIETKMRSLDAFHETMKIFYRKHLASKYPFFINWLVYLGINLKWWLARRKMQV